MRSECAGRRKVYLCLSNERFEKYDPHLAKFGAHRFLYDVPISIKAPTDMVDLVLDDFQARCNEMVLNDDDAFDVLLPANEQMCNIYDIQLNKSGKYATVIYGAIACNEYGYVWSGSGGSSYC